MKPQLKKLLKNLTCHLNNIQNEINNVNKIKKQILKISSKPIVEKCDDEYIRKIIRQGGL
jgi:hypothetical protein